MITVSMPKSCSPCLKHLSIILCATFLILLTLQHHSPPWASLTTKYTDAQRMPKWPELVKTAGANRTAQHARILVYNRVDKCGSSTLVQLIQQLGESTGRYAAFSSVIYWDRHLNTTAQHELVSWMVRESEHQPLLFERHVHFINFSHFHRDPPIYINQVRDPVERFISFFYYGRLPIHWKSNETVPRDDWLHKNLSACVATGDPECSLLRAHQPHGPDNARDQFGPMTAFFCGHEAVCGEFNHPAALQKALQNMEKQYSVVGVLEELSMSIAVLEAYVPLYFQGLSSNSSAQPVWKNGNTERPEVPQEIRNELKQRMSADYELYQFALQRLYLQFARIVRLLEGGRVT